MIDTEARRALHYADRFKFRHLEFRAPFGPDDYLAAIEHCVKKGAKQIIIDSASLEHDGTGGVLEMHEAELQRMGGQDRNSFAAWAKPKSARRRLLNGLTQFQSNFIPCFRAKEKMKPKKGQAPEEMGFMPISGDEFIYEMTINALLLPNSNGVPTWNSNEIGERMMIKLPEQFRQLASSKAPLSEDTGEMLARWAAGDAAPSAQPRVANVTSIAPQAIFPKSYPQWGGQPVESAPVEEIARYMSGLQTVLNDPAKKGAHAATTRHLAAAEAVYEQKMAAETASANAEYEGLEQPPDDYDSETGEVVR